MICDYAPRHFFLIPKSDFLEFNGRGPFCGMNKNTWQNALIKNLILFMRVLSFYVKIYTFIRNSMLIMKNTSCATARNLSGPFARHEIVGLFLAALVRMAFSFPFSAPSKILPVINIGVEKNCRNAINGKFQTRRATK